MIIAEHKATNLAVRVLGWWGVVLRFRNAICHTSGMQFVTLQECNLSRFRNATKGVACAQTSSHLGMQLKYLVYKKLCILT